jgi:hypothetical protein
MANRIWALHFGTGIVSTVDNLGASGAKPSHPELLDYLADTFVTNGWSIKAIHRLILRSAVYRQSSMSSVAASKGDPGNQLLSRFPLRRLDAEAIRDAQLQISGELDPSRGGPYVASQRNGEGVVEIPEESPGAHRRSLYLQQRRTQVVTFLQLFDAPAMVSTCGRRVSSTVPLQALALLNSDFTRRRANSFAKRLGREAGDQLKSRLDLAWRLACGKTPGPEERKICEEFLEKQRAFHAGKPDGDIMIWTDLCQMILSSNAFLYVE